MKKIILSIAVLMFTVFYVNAQSYTLTWEGEAIGDTVVITPESETTTELVFEAIFHNFSTNNANIKVIREQISLVEHSVNYFCWGACYPPQIDTSGMHMFVEVDSASAVGDFSSHYEIHESVGITIVTFTFYNMDHPDENVKVVVKFDTSPNGINENILRNIIISDIYPNPANSQLAIDYDMPSEVEEASVKIVNILGSVVKEQKINTNDNKMRMDVSDLNGGIYFYSVTINGEIYRTKKLIIR